MQTFKDNKNRKWVIDLTIAKVRRLRDALGLDLMNPQHYVSVLQSLTDQLSFVFLLVEHEAKEEGIDADGFERRLQGEGIATGASLAFLNELAVFFRKFDLEAFAKMADNSIRMRKKAQASFNEMIASGRFDSAMEQATMEMEAMLHGIDGNTSPTSVQSQAGNPGQP